MHFTKEANKWRFSLDNPNSSGQSSSSQSGSENSTTSGGFGECGTNGGNGGGGGGGGGNVAGGKEGEGETRRGGNVVSRGTPLVTLNESKMERYVEHAKMCLKVSFVVPHLLPLSPPSPILLLL